MVDDAHLVGFGVAHAYRGVVIFDCSHVRSYSLFGHSSCQTGLRFSRNEANALLEVRRAADARVFQDGAFEVAIDAGDAAAESANAWRA